jgi:hypothetical protein
MHLNKELRGRRVVLVHCTDPYTDLKCGDKGTVLFEDDALTLHVKWDRGGTLGMTMEDRYTIMPEGYDG